MERTVIYLEREPERSTVTGAYDWEDRIGWAVRRGFGPTEETRQVGDKCYRRMGSGRWRRSRADDVGATCDAALFSDPTTEFDLYRRIANLRELGKEQVRGVETTHYRGVLNIGAVKGPLDLWIDENDVVRRSRQSGEEARSFVSTWEYYDFGVKVEVTAPAGAQ